MDYTLDKGVVSRIMSRCDLNMALKIWEMIQSGELKSVKIDDLELSNLKLKELLLLQTKRAMRQEIGGGVSEDVNASFSLIDDEEMDIRSMGSDKFVMIVNNYNK